MLREFAPAKLNLYLHITGRRADGYHLLDSLVAFADVGDVLEAIPHDTLQLDVKGPFAQGLSAGDDNLVLRAAHALQQALGVTKGAHITLTKQLPVASGIGGGSADAAAALWLLPQLWEVTADAALLDSIALSLGADVPVCLRGQAARMSGIGEVVEPVSAWQPLHALLVNPGIAVATKEVFARREGAFRSPLAAAITDVDAMCDDTMNDLQRPAIALCPVIGEVLAALQEIHGCQLARMSGSGATCFGIFESEAQAIEAEHMFRIQHPQWWSIATRLS